MSFNIFGSAFKGDLEILLDLVSPSFFKVVSPIDLMKVSANLAKNFADEKNIQVILKDPAILDLLKLPSAVDRVLSLYFFQLLRRNRAVLDIRHKTLQSVGEWTPKGVHWEWDKSFLEGMRDVYIGYFTMDDGQFDRGLNSLGLSLIKEDFLAHFANSRDQPVQLKVSSFKSSFHQIFKKCQNLGIKLHSDFIPFGIYIGCLYENLDHFDESIDIRKIFMNTYGK